MFELDLKSRKSIYEQVMDNLKEQIMTGTLQAGDKLPSVRELSKAITVNPNTIQKAYQELEKLGSIYTVKGRGNFVASHTSWKVDRKNEYLEIMNDALRELKALGVSRDEVVASIDSLYKD